MKALFTLLVAVLACVQLSYQNCSPDTLLDRTNSTIYFCDVNDANSTFVLSKSPNNTVDWTLEGENYKVLGSEACLPGQGYIHNGEDFFCNPDLSLTADALAQLLLSCLGSNNLPVWNGTAWICSVDFDLLQFLNCAPGQVPKAANGTYVCADDNDALGQLLVLCGPGPFVPVFNNGVFDCRSNRTGDLDTLRDLIPTCTNGYIPKYLNGTWACALDTNFLAGFTCPAGTVLKRLDNSTWGCGTDFDTFANLTLNCSSLGPGFDTPILNETGWTCKEVPTYTVSSTLGTVLYVNTYKFDETGTQTDYFVGYYPVRPPYKGLLKAFGLRPIAVDGNPVTVQGFVTINGVEVPGTRLSQTFPAFGLVNVQGLEVPVAAGDSVDISLTSTGAIAFVSSEIYIQLDTSP